MGAYKYLSQASLLEYVASKQTHMMISSCRSAIHKVNAAEGETISTWDGSNSLSVHANCGDFVLHVIDTEGSPVVDSLGHIVRWVESAESFAGKFILDEEGFAVIKKDVHSIVLAEECMAFTLPTGELAYVKKGDALDVTESTNIWNYSYTVFSQLFKSI